MNRETFCKLYNKIINGTINKKELTNLFMEYCTIEHNKDINKSKIFVSTIISSRLFLSDYLNYLIQYYCTKFNICKVFSKEDINGKRNILLIY